MIQEYASTYSLLSSDKESNKSRGRLVNRFSLKALKLKLLCSYLSVIVKMSPFLKREVYALFNLCIYDV